MNGESLNSNSLPEMEIYKFLLQSAESIISPEEPVITALSNAAAIIKEAFGKVSWAGFYLLRGDLLFLGPYQGKPACTCIPIGKGVCGTAAVKKETIVVDDTSKFNGHIACDSSSRSEIVVPLISKNGYIYGVLDLDSREYSAFGTDDRECLEEFVRILADKIDLEKTEKIVI